MRDDGTPLLEVSGLEVDIGTAFRLGPVSFRVDGRERIALIGPSGSGKTTLLRQIIGHGPASVRGCVLVRGTPVTALHHRDRARDVGMLSQSHDLVEQLRVRHNVQAGLLGRWGVLRALWALVGPVRAPAALEALERVGLAARSEDRTSELSGGERQRVALARLLVQGPRLMLADEPVASLDPSLADDVLRLLTGLAAEDGRALLCSLHQPDLAVRHFDRVIGIAGGRLAFDVPASEADGDRLAGLYGTVLP